MPGGEPVVSQNWRHAGLTCRVDTNGTCQTSGHAHGNTDRRTALPAAGSKIRVEFRDLETGQPVGLWTEVTHWVPTDEQVWCDGSRYKVVRVEHFNPTNKLCVVRPIG